MKVNGEDYDSLVEWIAGGYLDNLALSSKRDSPRLQQLFPRQLLLGGRDILLRRDALLAYRPWLVPT